MVLRVFVILYMLVSAVRDLAAGNYFVYGLSLTALCLMLVGAPVSVATARSGKRATVSGYFARHLQQWQR